MPALPYNYSRDPKWTRSVYDAILAKKITMTVRTDNATSVTVAGECPNCRDQFTDSEILRGAVDVGGVLGGANEGALLDDIEDEEVIALAPATLRCTCTGRHPKRPPGETGCGIRFTVRATRKRQS